MASERPGGLIRPGRSTTEPTIGLVLGGGGARGLAHVLMLEVFDELGLKPKVIAGTSIGAVFGAAYASGVPARTIRAHTEEVLRRRFSLLRDVANARARSVTRFWNVLTARDALLAPAAVLDIMLPPGVARDFADLDIPLKIVASDYYALAPTVISSGPLREAIAASMALPVIFDPVIIGGRTLIDGGLTNPLPFNLLEGEADIIVAIDVSGETVRSEKRAHPTALEALFGASFLFERSIVREKLKARQPDIYISAGTGHFQTLEFLKVRDILAAAQPAKDRLKQQLARVLGADTLPALTEEEEPARPQLAMRRRRLLPRLRHARPPRE